MKPADVKVLLDTVWVLLGGVLVFFMNAGFALVESGLVRKKNTVNVLAKNFIVFGLGVLGFWSIGYALMFRIAAGDKLGFGQDDVTLSGWAIECRINAEDPYASFIPSPGRVAALRAPGGPGVRDDTGVYAGCTIPRFYDTLMAKLIAWGPDREAATARMARALGEYTVVGVQTTIPILQRIIAHPDFAAGRLSTAFMERLLAGDRPEAAGRYRRVALIAAALTAYERAGRSTLAPAATAPASSAWRQAVRPGWRQR